ncbi:MAG: hypothetical protein Q4E00_02955 [Actinomyces bowdenii]|nr:hypothetical protein [Actinomyces bowdenii]
MDADAAQELRRMGLTAELLTTACVEGLCAADSQHGPYEPAISLGFQRWSKIVGALRAALEAEGWGKHDRFNAPRSVSPDKTVTIAAIGGDAWTGRPEGKPANARARGRVLRGEVEANARCSPVSGIQTVLDLQGVPEADGGVESVGTQTWILLYFWDGGARVLRSELSLPSSCSNGIIDLWERRILLPEVPIDETVVVLRSDVGPSDDVDFEMTAVG